MVADESIQNIFILLAVATPVVAFLIAQMHQVASPAGQPEAQRRKNRRNLWLLGLAGPFNFLVWLILERWPGGFVRHEVAGWVLAVVVFAVVGWATGFFGRLRRK